MRQDGISVNYELILINLSRNEELDCILTSHKHVADIHLFISRMCVRQRSTVFSVLIDLEVYLASN